MSAHTPDPQMRRMDGEAWLARRLGKKGVLVKLFDGLTDSNMRKETLRQEIRSRNVIDVPVHHELTYGGAFFRLYGEHV